jgi:hypothetical protein
MGTRAVTVGIVFAALLSAAPRLEAEEPNGVDPPRADELPVPAGDRSTAESAGTSFTYQGQIKQNNVPINGNADLRITIWDDDIGGGDFGTSTHSNLPVSNGIVTVTLNSGRMWWGDARWLQIEVRFPAGSGNFTSLSPRQPVLAVPYAMGFVPEAYVTGASSDAILRLENSDPNGEALEAVSGGRAIVASSSVSNGVEAYSNSPTACGVRGQNDGGGLGVSGRVTNGGIAVAGSGGQSGLAGFFTEGDVLLGPNSTLRVGSGHVEVLSGNQSFGATTRQMINLWNTTYGIGVQPYTHYSRADVGAGFAWYQGGQHVDIGGDPGGGTMLMLLDNNGRIFNRNGITAHGANTPSPLVVTGVNVGDTEFRVSDVGEVFADGTFHAGGADFAELLPAEEGLEPGDALVIGHDGKLAKSNETYQTSVVGVYSTQPGVLGGSNDVSHEGKVPLAVVGVVPVKVTDENGAIAPGDLLTTSSMPGVAMKASPEITSGGRTSYPSGSIIGKALSGLETGQGTIQVLLVAK